MPYKALASLTRAAQPPAGVFIKTVSGVKTAAPAGLKFSQAQVKLTKFGELGTGLLLGVSAATKPDSQVLSALGFSLLQLPSSSSVAVDMPAIDINSIKVQPQVVVKSSISATGAGVNQATCPDFSTSVGAAGGRLCGALLAHCLAT